MQSKKIVSERMPLMGVWLGVILFVVPLALFTTKNFVQDNAMMVIEHSDTISDQKQSDVDLPVALKIPSINVDAPVEYVGLMPNGAMDVPKSPDKVAWFNLGSRPGEAGNAVIAGHYGWKNNRVAVFDDLHKLRMGDTILVEDKKGVVSTFVVRETRTYGKDEAVPNVFGSSDGEAHLNLITCIGDWDNTEKTYAERLVVFTDKQ